VIRAAVVLVAALLVALPDGGEAAKRRCPEGKVAKVKVRRHIHVARRDGRKIRRVHRHRRVVCVTVKPKPAPAPAPAPAPEQPAPAPAAPPTEEPWTAPPSEAPPPASATGYLQVTAKEFTFSLSRPSVPAGATTVELLNNGEDEHDLLVQREGGSGPRHTVGTASPGGGTVAKTLSLSAGRWTLWCSLAGHKELGMRATLQVG
jgi:hypothetical protein